MEMPDGLKRLYEYANQRGATERIYYGAKETADLMKEMAEALDRINGFCDAAILDVKAQGREDFAVILSTIKLFNSKSSKKFKEWK